MGDSTQIPPQPGEAVLPSPTATPLDNLRALALAPGGEKAIRAYLATLSAAELFQVLAGIQQRR